jgi:hypothetical protein
VKPLSISQVAYFRNSGWKMDDGESPQSSQIEIVCEEAEQLAQQAF